MYYFNNLEKTPFNYVMGVMLDQCEYYRDYCSTHKGKLLWDQIHMLHWYAWNLRQRYDYTCCSGMNSPHLPFSCQFNHNETLASYGNGRYYYYDVERVEEFVAFKGAYEIESLFEKFEDFDDSVYRPENLVILKYCYDNYDIEVFIENNSAVQEENNILQESMEEGIDETVSSLDEKDDEESEEQKEEEQISYLCPPSNERTLQLIHCLISLRACRRMNAMMIDMIP